jgi:hypothetical protein
MKRSPKHRGTWIPGLLLALLMAFGPLPSLADGLAAAQPAVTAEGLASPGTPAAAGLDADWWSAVQEDIRTSEYHITWQEQTYLLDLPAAYQAPNRAHNLRTYFTPGGPIVIPRVWGEESDVPPWRWEARLVAWGRAGALEAVPAAALEVQENRIEYLRGDIQEWFNNDEEGLAQGWRIDAPPQAGDASAPLQLDLILGGDLSPQISDAGTEVEFTTGEGQPVLHYQLLAAADAAGRALSAWLSLSGDTLSILVDDTMADYPIQVGQAITGLPTGRNWDFTEPQDDAQAGTSVATAGDVDGDGYSDAIVGVPYYDGGATDEGRVYVFYGSILGLLGSDPWRKESDQAYAHFGASVATAGDVNGDGFADVIVGAPDYDHPEEDEGGAWVYRGSQNGVIDVPVFFAQANLIDAHMGDSVATAGNVNGEDAGIAYADIIVGASGYSQGDDYEGAAFVWHGSANGVNNGDYFGTPSNADWMAESNQYNARLGTSVATAGDVNRDGYADVIVGADNYTHGTSQEGAAFVWHGSGTGLNNGVDGNPTNTAWMAEGNNFEAHFGHSASTAGDVNGDGYADVIVGAPHYSNGESDEGGAWLYLGSASGLNASWANQDEGNQAGAWFGQSVATAGDVNGDGYADVIVGAPFRTDGENEEGHVYVWYGQPSSSGISSIRDWEAEGNRVQAWYGWSVATAGDVNADGYSDIIVGAPGVLDRAGRVYAYHGGADSLEETAAWSKYSNQEQAYYGWSVGTAGDVNGDGYADVIVGAPRWDSGKTDEGYAWVYLGQEGGLSPSPHWDKGSNNESAEYGYSVGTAGDVNGDGYDDVIVGAPGWHIPESETDEGAAFVYAGSVSGLDRGTPPLWDKDSDQIDARFGHSVGTAGDVNGDGYADIVVGAPFWQSGGEERGAVWLYYGSAGGSHSAPDWYNVGDQEEARYGYAVGTAGDVNGDGYSDVIVGSPYWQDDTNANEGRAWVYLGSAGGLRHDLHWHAESNNFNAQLGHSVGTAGDVDGDGYGDVIVGAPYFGDGGLTSEGKVWVFHGSALGLDMSARWSRESGQNGAYYGYSVGTAGDVNGDGYADVILGAPHMTGSVSDEGTTRVYLGSRDGLLLTYDWKGEGGQLLSWYGQSVGTAGDVNGDGYAEVIVGAPQYDRTDRMNEGWAFVYYGNGGPGVSLRPRQQHRGGEPLAHLGRSDDMDSFRVRLRAGTPFGRGRIVLECEVKPLGTPFTGSDTLLWGSNQNAIPGDDKYIVPHDLLAGMPYHWRVRWRYEPSTTPWMPASRWLTMPWNGWNEQDLRTAGFRVALPVVMKDH